MKSIPCFVALIATLYTSLTLCAEDLLITLGKDTTLITQPLKPDGYPDYLAALNARFGRGISPQKNFSVALWKTTGPIQISKDLKPGFFEALGIDDLPKEGDYLVDFITYYRKLLDLDAADTKSADYEAKSNKVEEAYGQVMEKKWTQKTQPVAYQWYEENKTHIEKIIQFTETHDQYFNPYVLTPGALDEGNSEFSPELIAIQIPGSLQIREVARTLSISTNYHLGRGDIDAAMRNSIAIHRMGRLAAQGGTVVEGLVGIAIGSMAFSLDRQILASDELSAKQLHAYLTHLRSLPPMPDLLDKINLAERYMFLDTAIHIAKYGPSALDISNGSIGTPSAITKGLGKALSSGVVNWDHVLRQGNYWYDELYRVGEIKNLQERTKKYVEFENRLETLARESSDPVNLAKKILLSGKSLPEITSDQISNYLICLMLPSLSGVLSAEDRAFMEIEISQIGILLELHYLKNGAYPTNLNALISPTLKQIPLDRFNENGLTYRSKGQGYLLYSFGRDRQDNQGRSYFDEPAADDIVIKREH